MDREFNLIFKPYIFDLKKDYQFFKVTGKDSERFLNGQLTSDVASLKEKHFHLSARTSRTGQLVSFFYIGKLKENSFFIVVPRDMGDSLIEDLDKFIIMDEVSITECLEQHTMKLRPYCYCADDAIAEGEFFGRRAFLCHGNVSNDDDPLLQEDQKILETLSLWPVWGESAWQEKLITESFLVTRAVSLEKGCFLGQETIAKIVNRRGGACCPVLVKLKGEALKFHFGKEIYFQEQRIGTLLSSCFFKGEQYIQVHLHRDYRVDQKELSFRYEGKLFVGTVLLNLLLSFSSERALAEECYHFAVHDFKENKEQSALSKLDLCIKIDPSFSDAYESKGVILGRQGHYEEAISLMDKLLESDSSSVMAHTNKSLFLMKLGKIEEAEEEKSIATVKSFEQNAKQAGQKKLEEERLQKEQAEMSERKEMFRQVLEIDERDVIANYGMADILYKQKEYSKALEHLEIVLEENEKHSLAYLLSGKCFLELHELEKAEILWKRGVEIASQKGEMMPANEMQNLLLKLK